MTTVVLSRRNLIVAGGPVLGLGVFGRLLVPASAAGLAPTTSMWGGSNNYRKGAPIVERIGKGGFWMSGTVRRAGDGAPLSGQRIQIWAHTAFGQEHEPKLTERRSPTRTGLSVSRDRRSFRSLANRMVTLPMTAVNSKPSFCAP